MYADVEWGDISEECCKELQRLQNRSSGIILRKDTSNDPFHVLNWLNLAPRIKKHKCILVFKCLNKIPKYLTQYFTRNVDLYDRTTRRRNDLHSPKLKYAGNIHLFQFFTQLF